MNELLRACRKSSGRLSPDFGLRPTAPSDMNGAMEEIESQTALLFDAIESEDFVKVKKCVRSGADLSDKWTNEQGLTPFELAWSTNSSEIGAFLYEECSLYTDIIRRSSGVLLDREFIFLRATCSNGDSERVRHFIRTGVDVNKRDALGRGYLWAACENGHLEIVNMLLKAGAKPTFSKLALAAACFYNHVEVVKVLIGAGANAKGTDLTDRGLLWAALANNYVEVAKLLIEAGADISQTYEADQGLLLSALKNNQADFAKLLIDAGANVNESNEFGELPLRIVCHRGDVEIARLLINAGANVDEYSSHESRLLIIACRRGYFEIAQLLVDAGANVNADGYDSSVPLVEACSEGHVEIAKLLLDNGADVDGKDDDYRTERWPLQIACSRCDARLAKVLIDAGANVNQTNEQGETLLHFLAESWRDAVQPNNLLTLILLTSPSLIDIPDENGSLPHELAPTSQELFEAWTSYRYSKLYSHGTTKPKKIKVCVVGKERAGKTTLIKTLQNIDWREGGDDVRTASMAVTTVTVDSAGELVFCDFAGQPFFYKTHGLFFSETTTMFLLVVDLTQSYDELRESSHFILSFVKCSGAFTEKANVLVLGSKMDLLSDLKSGENKLRRLFRYLHITFGAWFDFQENYFLLNCRDGRSNELDLLKKAIGDVKEKTIETASDVPMLVEAAVASFLPALRNPSKLSAVPPDIRYSFSNESAESMREKCLTLLSGRGLLTPEKENRCMAADAFKQIMVSSIYPGLTEQVQTLLVEYLQGIGEIFVMEDKIILELSWLCHSVLGPLLSPDEFQITLSCSPPGTTTKEKMKRALEAFNKQKWDNIDETLSLLCRLEICFELPDRPNTYQFPALIQQERSPKIWCRNAQMTVYVGRRWKREDDTDIITPGTMPFLQCHVRNTECFCGLEPVLWQGGLMIKKRIGEFSLEGMVVLQDVDKALDFVVRGPEHSESECMKLLKDLMRTGEKVLQEKSPGMERHLWYISCSELKELKESPGAYRKETIEKVIKNSTKSSASLSEGTIEDSLKELFALPDNHIDYISYQTRCVIDTCLEKDEVGRNALASALLSSSPADIVKSAISGDILALWSENLNATAQSLANAARKSNVLYLLSLLQGEGAIELSADEKAAAAQNLQDLLNRPACSSQKIAIASNFISFPSHEAMVSECLDFKMVVAKVGNNEWKAIAEYLGYQSHELTDLPLMDTNSKRLQHIIDEWSAKEGKKANVGELLRACERAGVPLFLIQAEYTKKKVTYHNM